MQFVDWIVRFLSGLALLLGLPGPLGEALVAVLLLLGLLLPCYLAYRSLHAASASTAEGEEVITRAGRAVSIYSLFRDASSEYYPEVQAIAALEKQICQHARDAIQRAVREGKISGAIASKALELYLSRMRSADELTSALRVGELREEIEETVAETAARIREVEERAAPGPPTPPAPSEEQPVPPESEAAPPPSPPAAPSAEALIPEAPEAMEEAAEEAEAEAAADTLLEALQATEGALGEAEEAPAQAPEALMPPAVREEEAAPVPVPEVPPEEPEAAPPAELEVTPPEPEVAPPVVPEEEPSREIPSDLSAMRRAMLAELAKIKEALEKE